jgi:hypothetical protein
MGFAGLGRASLCFVVLWLDLQRTSRERGC